MSLSGFRMTRLGRACTHAMVTVLETLRIAPKGTAGRGVLVGARRGRSSERGPDGRIQVHVSAMLNATAIDLVEGGKREIFTPSYFFLARKKSMLGF